MSEHAHIRHDLSSVHDKMGDNGGEEIMKENKMARHFSLNIDLVLVSLILSAMAASTLAGTRRQTLCRYQDIHERARCFEGNNCIWSVFIRKEVY